MFRDDIVLVLDFDGVLTDGKMYYNKNGKELKCIGADDWDLLKELSLFIKVNIITADKRGLPITLKRVEDEMEMELDVVTGKAIERWNWIVEKYPSQKIIFIGDGWNDYYALKKSDLGITTIDALQHVKDSADVVLKRVGGDRFVAEAVLFIAKHYNLFRVLQ